MCFFKSILRGRILMLPATKYPIYLEWGYTLLEHFRFTVVVGDGDEDHTKRSDRWQCHSSMLRVVHVDQPQEPLPNTNVSQRAISLSLSI